MHALLIYTIFCKADLTILTKNPVTESQGVFKTGIDVTTIGVITDDVAADDVATYDIPLHFPISIWRICIGGKAPPS